LSPELSVLSPELSVRSLELCALSPELSDLSQELSVRAEHCKYSMMPTIRYSCKVASPWVERSSQGCS